MNVRANIAGMYQAKLAAVALICLGAAGWFLYDGMIGYPNERIRAAEFEPFEAENRVRDWPKYAKEKGWPTAPPKDKSDGEIFLQKLIALVAALAALPFLAQLLRSWRRWIEMDDTGLRTSWGRQFKFSEITALDKKKWRNKGIAKIHYEQQDRKLRIAIDDWQFDTDATTQILRGVESNIAVDLILNGTPEPPPEEEIAQVDTAPAEDAS